MKSWDDLRIFMAVARSESLTAAAPVLKMDPATISRRIGRLEDAFGAALFAKSPQGYQLTDLGMRVWEEAVEAELAVSRTIDVGADVGAGLSGQIRIGAPDGCANFVLPQVCGAIQKANPGLEIQILALPRIVNLSRREADLAITVSPPEAGRLTVQKVSDYKLHLAMQKDLPAPQKVSDIKDLPAIGYIQDMIFDKELDYLNAIDSPSVNLASNSVSVQLQMLRNNEGIGIVHDFALPFAPELKRVLIDDVSLTRSFYLVRHTSDRQSERMKQFSEVLVHGMKAEIARLEQLAALT